MPGTFQENVPRSSEWAQQPQDDIDMVSGNRYTSGGRQGPVSLFPSTDVAQNEASYDRDDPHPVSAAGNAHEQEQRGVSHLSNAVSAVATNGALRHPVAQGSPSGGPANGLGQMAMGLSSVASTPNVSNQSNLEKRGPVEFNHAIGYVNKIKAGLFMRSFGAAMANTSVSNASINSQRFISSFWRFCKLINASQNPFKMFMLKSHSSSVLRPIFWRTSSSFYPNLQPKQRLKPQQHDSSKLRTKLR